DIGAGLGGSILRRHLIDGAAGIGADADLLGAVSAGAGIGAGGSILKRSLASGGIAAGVGADVLGSTADIGAGLGGSILRRHLIDGAAGIGADADLLGAVSAGAGIGAGGSILKREEEEKRSLASAGIAGGVGADVLGSSADIGAGAGASVLKRDVGFFEKLRSGVSGAGQSILSKFTGSVPRASFTVSDVAWVEGDLFKVTINFETVEAAKLFAKFQDELKSLSVGGVGDDGSDQLLWDGSSNSKIDNFAKWSSTVLVKASKHNNLYCLPDDFAIKFDWTAQDASELHSLWSKYFDTTYEYTFSKDFGTTSKKQNNIKVEKRCLEHASGNSTEADAQFDTSVLNEWKTSTNVLPNFCWPSHCSA
ncbi:hypothetical protein HYPBUDRAFT_11976, partial [Hyphopichia burtonii NRRL Y-1933]